MLAAVVAGGVPTLASAQDDARIAALEAQVQMLMEEIQAIKAEQARAQAMPAATQQAAAAPPAPSGAAQSMVIAETTQVPVALQTDLRTPPSPGVAGHPFYASLPDGRTTGIMATGTDKVRVTFSGQINRALNVIDDGLSTDLFQVDNENASSRFRFLGETSPLNDTQALALFEFEWPVNGTLDVNQLNPSPDINDPLNIRLLEVGFSNNNVGSFFFGQGWTASDGSTEIDISGITTPAWASEPYALYGMLVTDDQSPFDYVPKPGIDTASPTFDPTNASNFVSIGTLMNPLDGLSRLVRVRYNTPVWNGFQISASAATENRYDFALRYAGETSWVRLAAAAAYWTQDEDDGFDGWGGSASMILTEEGRWWKGLSFTVSAAQQSPDNPTDGEEPQQLFGKVAYVWNPFSVGRTGVALTYGEYNDYLSSNQSSSLYGVGVSQNFDQLGTELYGALYQADPEVDGEDVNKMTMFQFGAMVRF
jgi:type II secretory pathway pseudopilin PulG